MKEKHTVFCDSCGTEAEAEVQGTQGHVATFREGWFLLYQDKAPSRSHHLSQEIHRVCHTCAREILGVKMDAP